MQQSEQFILFYFREVGVLDQVPATTVYPLTFLEFQTFGLARPKTSNLEQEQHKFSSQEDVDIYNRTRQPQADKLSQR